MSNVDFKGFDGREERLRSIIRYNLPRFNPMFYRTNLLIHSRRVHHLVRDVIPVVIPKYDGSLDPEKTLTLVLVHDDAEIIIGDVQLILKDGMSAKELAKLDEDEVRAIEKLAQEWPLRINGFSYKELLYHALRKDCLEAQVVSYCDKIDAHCEALHELYAGNSRFSRPAYNYAWRIPKLVEKFSSLQKMFPSDRPILQIPKNVDVGKIGKNGQLHTLESLQRATGIPAYDRWKEITIEYFGVGPLLEIKES